MWLRLRVCVVDGVRIKYIARLSTNQMILIVLIYGLDNSHAPL